MVDHVQGVCVHVGEKNEAKLHWLSHLAISPSPLATQWLTQQLIGVLKASYLTHQNNKRLLSCWLFLLSLFCATQECLLSLPLLFVGLSQTAYAHIPLARNCCTSGETLQADVLKLCGDRVIKPQCFLMRTRPTTRKKKTHKTCKLVSKFQGNISFYHILRIQH